MLSHFHMRKLSLREFKLPQIIQIVGHRAKFSSLGLSDSRAQSSCKNGIPWTCVPYFYLNLIIFL